MCNNSNDSENGRNSPPKDVCQRRKSRDRQNPLWDVWGRRRRRDAPNDRRRGEPVSDGAAEEVNEEEDYCARLVAVALLQKLLLNELNNK